MGRPRRRRLGPQLDDAQKLSEKKQTELPADDGSGVRYEGDSVSTKGSLLTFNAISQGWCFDFDRSNEAVPTNSPGCRKHGARTTSLDNSLSCLRHNHAALSARVRHWPPMPVTTMRSPFLREAAMGAATPAGAEDVETRNSRCAGTSAVRLRATNASTTSLEFCC